MDYRDYHVTLDEYIALIRIAMDEAYPSMRKERWHPEDLNAHLMTVIPALTVGMCIDSYRKAGLLS